VIFWFCWTNATRLSPASFLAWSSLMLAENPLTDASYWSRTFTSYVLARLWLVARVSAWPRWPARTTM
jgi:hypothetical protein